MACQKLQFYDFRYNFADSIILVIHKCRGFTIPLWLLYKAEKRKNDGGKQERGRKEVERANKKVKETPEARKRKRKMREDDDGQKSTVEGKEKLREKEVTEEPREVEIDKPTEQREGETRTEEEKTEVEAPKENEVTETTLGSLIEEEVRMEDLLDDEALYNASISLIDDGITEFLRQENQNARGPGIGKDMFLERGPNPTPSIANSTSTSSTSTDSDSSTSSSFSSTSSSSSTTSTESQTARKNFDTVELKSILQGKVIRVSEKRRIYTYKAGRKQKKESWERVYFLSQQEE